MKQVGKQVSLSRTMAKSVTLIFALWALPAAASAKKENDPTLISFKKDVSVAASYQSDGNVKISALAKPPFSEKIVDIVLYKAALEAEKSGFLHFSVIRKKFWSYYVYGNLINANAVVVVKFVKSDDATALPDRRSYINAIDVISSFKKLFGESETSLPSKTTLEGLPTPTASGAASRIPPN